MIMNTLQHVSDNAGTRCLPIQSEEKKKSPQQAARIRKNSPLNSIPATVDRSNTVMLISSSYYMENGKRKVTIIIEGAEQHPHNE